MDQGIDVPPYFLCPISLDIMKDPVTVPTGITYDRESIERWIYSSSSGPATCPVTKQPLSLNSDLITPNHTLRRLIQSWCTLNAVERFPTPKPPITRAHLSKLISRARHGHVIPVLRELQPFALESAANCRALESAGVISFLCSVISSDGHALEAVDLALTVLLHLNVSERDLVGVQNDAVLESLTRVINRSGSYETRGSAVQLVKLVLETAQPTELARIRPELFSGLVRVIQDPESLQATIKAALTIIVHASQWGRNRVKAVEAGAVGAAVEMLLDGATERRAAEMAVVVVDRLCGCAEGRAVLVAHGGGIAALMSKRTMRVSGLATERAVRAMWAVAKHSATERVVREMAEVGAVGKLWMVMQVECDGRVKEMAREILRMHAAAWKGSPCVRAHLLPSYSD